MRNKKSKASGILIALLAMAYSFVAPYLNQKYGLSLPALNKQANQPAVVTARQSDDGSSNSDVLLKSEPSSQSSVTSTKEDGKLEQTDRAAENVSRTDTTKRSPGPLAERVDRSTNRSTTAGSSRQSSPRGPPEKADKTEEADTDLAYGLLREISPDRFISPEGLLYTKGSAEGHRIKHVERHTKDQPSRPGSHGVFDGELPGALKTIDRAYERAKKNQRTTKKVDEGRTIYTVDMGGRVGYVGGRDGNRKRKPMARRVRLVLEGNRVITAYPM